MKIVKLFTILLSLSIFVNSPFSKVEKPNYDFSLKALEVFKPGNTYQQIKEKYGKGELIKINGDMEQYRFYVAHIRYKFSVYIQTFKGTVLDFYAVLPSYFIHDIFFQSIINKFGAQDSYTKKHNNAVYIWNNKSNVRYIYSGSCTITCFPLYFTAMLIELPSAAGAHRPMLEQLRKKIN